MWNATADGNLSSLRGRNLLCTTGGSSVMDGAFGIHGNSPGETDTPLEDVTIEKGENACKEWGAYVHETLAARILPSSDSIAVRGFVEQLATASRVLMLIPRTRPQDARAIEFPMAARMHEMVVLRGFGWKERRRDVAGTFARDGRRSVRIEADFAGEIEQDIAQRDQLPPLHCTTVTTLEWLPRSIKPRTLSFAIVYDDGHRAFSSVRR